MNFDHYFTNEEIEEKLQEWAKKYPKLVKVVTIGETYEKRPLRLLVITNQDTGPDTSKPAVWLDGNIHAAEITGSVVALRVAECAPGRLRPAGTDHPPAGPGCLLYPAARQSRRRRPGDGRYSAFRPFGCAQLSIPGN